eukprot:349940_1
MDTSNILQEGWLEKKSKYVGAWRPRWIVVTTDTLYSYKNKKCYKDPTEIISGLDMISVEQINEDNITFSLKLKMRSIQFKCTSESNIFDWLYAINICLSSIIIPINIVCKRMKDYNCKYKMNIPYHNNYSIDRIINDIINHLQNQYKPIKFQPKIILSDSFLGQKLHYADYDWNNCDIKINDYPKEHVIENGIHLEIDIAIYNHNVASRNAIDLCDYMKNNN